MKRGWRCVTNSNKTGEVEKWHRPAWVQSLRVKNSLFGTLWDPISTYKINLPHWSTNFSSMERRSKKFLHYPGWNFLYKMTTAKSCCFIQDKNIDKHYKTAKRKATWCFLISFGWTSRPSSGDLRWLDTVFQGQYLPSLSINYVAINKVLEKLPPQLY